LSDFTIKQYIVLLKIFQERDFSFQSFFEFTENKKENIIILRHDVDKVPFNSLKTAQIENELGIKGSYYFRIVPHSYNESIIKQIAALGHEIGYHYETMVTCRGNVEKAYDEFCMNLANFRNLYPIKTICMHGSPLSKYDNRDIWKKYDYRSLGITGEPYFDIDFSKVFYLTDTGRRWDGDKVSVRDKVSQEIAAKWPIYHSTEDIIRAIHLGKFPEGAMITVHPQHWTDRQVPWMKELLVQRLKNAVKRMVVRWRS